MRKGYKWLMLVVVFITMITISPVKADSAWHYAMLFDGKKVGTSHISRIDAGQGSYFIKQETALHITSIWGDVDLSGKLVDKYDAKGRLLLSDHKEKIGEETWWTRIEQSDGTFLAFRSELTTDKQKDDAELLDLGAMAVSHLVPGAANVMAIGEILLDEGPDKQKADRFNSDSFDTSFLNLPAYWRKSGKTLPETIRIFETTDVLTYTARIAFKGKKNLKTAIGPLETWHFLLTDKDDNPSDIWLAEGANKIPFFAKIAGKDDGEAFEMILEKQE